ncbi:MAG: hypothetical protein QOJ73_333 [Streptosporangiaceae bacterium]|jgi:tetratricopeptide (TPR) repeat protein|nr:hypothetical protein [Streptosporangiaceae bacterium]
MRFAQPDQSWAVIIGTASYICSDLPGLPSVANNLTAFRDVLTDPQLGGLHPDHCAVIPDPSALPALGVELARVARLAEDTLIVYYAGHGLLDDHGALFLALQETDPDHVVYTALPLAWIKQAVSDSPARSRILILDCCFSGRAIEAMASPSALVSGQIEIAGAYTLTSAPANEPARAPAGARYTAFTAELLNILRNGLENGTEGLSLGDVYLELKRAHLARGLPPPQQRNTATVDRLGIVRNMAYQCATLLGPSGPTPDVPPALWPPPPSSDEPAAPSVGGILERDHAPAPLWASGLAAWRAGDLDGADQLIRHAIESATDDHAIWAASIVLGLLRRDGHRDLEAAEALLERAIDCDDAQLAALGRLHRGCVLELRGDTCGAERDYRQLIIDTPVMDCAAFAAVRLGWLLTDKGCDEEAEQTFRAGRKLGDSPAKVWLTLGLGNILMESGRSDEAADMFEEVLASENGSAKAFAALGARQACLGGGLTIEAAEYARLIAQNPDATPLWPVVLSDERPSTPDGRIYAMSKWLTWLRSGVGESICLTGKSSRQQFILFENQDAFTMSVCVVPRALPRRLRGNAKELSRQLAIMGFELQDEDESPLDGDTEFWVMNVADKTDDELAAMSNDILMGSLVGRCEFILEVEPAPAITCSPQPRPPLPDLLPD